MEPKRRYFESRITLDAVPNNLMDAKMANRLMKDALLNYFKIQDIHFGFEIHTDEVKR